VIARALAKSPEQRYPTDSHWLTTLRSSSIRRPRRLEAARRRAAFAPMTGRQPFRRRSPTHRALDLRGRACRARSEYGVTGNMPPASRVRKVQGAHPSQYWPALRSFPSPTWRCGRWRFLATLRPGQPCRGPGKRRSRRYGAARDPSGARRSEPRAPQREPFKSPPMSHRRRRAGPLRLKLAFAHPLTRGTLRLWIDDEWC
jgi:hypothetical protein